MEEDYELDDIGYDSINAPQYLDFSQLGINDDDEEADKFFEMHREEDDFVEGIKQVVNERNSFTLFDDEHRNASNESEPQSPHVDEELAIIAMAPSFVSNGSAHEDEPCNTKSSSLHCPVRYPGPSSPNNISIGIEPCCGKSESIQCAIDHHQTISPNVNVSLGTGNSHGGEPSGNRSEQRRVLQQANSISNEISVAVGKVCRKSESSHQPAVPVSVSLTDLTKRKGPSSVSSTTSSGRSASRPPTPKKAFPPKITTPQPFSFLERDRELQRKKELKLQELREKENKPFQFHATPLPSFVPKQFKKANLLITQVKPFKFRSDERGAIRQHAFKAKVDAEEKNLQESKKFHANPPTVVYRKPFEPVLGTLPLAEPLDILLNSDIRAEQRRKFDEYLKKKDEEEETRRQQEEAERLEREKHEEMLLRKQLVHKANPLKPMRAFQVKSSGRQLTSPKSPAFSKVPMHQRMNRQYRSNSELNTAV